MSINGRISIDAIFHDKDGTASFKVVSLNDSREYTTGKVAIISGTVGTTEVTFTTYDDGESPTSTYRDASGELVSLTAITKVALKATTQTRHLVFVDSTGQTSIFIRAGEVLVYPCSTTPGDNVSVCSFTGTASYTIILIGT